jgi:hypothetical protein
MKGVFLSTKLVHPILTLRFGMDLAHILAMRLFARRGLVFQAERNATDAVHTLLAMLNTIVMRRYSMMTIQEPIQATISWEE